MIIAGHNTQLLITDDSWINCKSLNINGLKSLWYNSDEIISYISTSSSMSTNYHVSLDNGETWEITNVGNFKATKLYFIDDNIGFIIGNLFNSDTS